MRNQYSPRERAMIGGYRVLRVLTLIGWLGLLIVTLQAGVETERALSIRIFVCLMGIPVIAPVFHGLIFGDDQPHHLFVFAGIMAIFSSFGMSSAPNLSLPLLVIWVVVFFITFANYHRIRAQKEAQRRAIKAENQPPTPVKVERLERVDTPQQLAALGQQIEGIDRDLVRYRQHLSAIGPQLATCQTYLQRIQNQLQQPQLSDEQRRTSLQLQRSLHDRLDSLKLLLDFYTLVIDRLNTDRTNLTVAQGNWEVASYLHANEIESQVQLVAEGLLDPNLSRKVERLDAQIWQDDPHNPLGGKELPEMWRYHLIEIIEGLRNA